jgi:hypothetical protein
MDTSIELLRQKSESARIDANKAHARIPQLRKSKLRKDLWFAVSAVERMFLENADSLENDIKSNSNTDVDTVDQLSPDDKKSS